MGTFIVWVIVIYIVSCFLAFYAMALAWIKANPEKDTLYDVCHGYKGRGIPIASVTFMPIINTFVSCSLWSLYIIGLFLNITIRANMKYSENGDKEES